MRLNYPLLLQTARVIWFRPMITFDDLWTLLLSLLSFCLRLQSLRSLRSLTSPVAFTNALDVYGLGFRLFKLETLRLVADG